MILQVLCVAIGGACGAMCRFMIHMLVQSLFALRFPLGTLISNTLGSFITGILFMCLAHWSGVGAVLLSALFLVGFCGALTTFSSFSLETVHLYINGRPLIAALNMTLNIVLCFVLVGFGTYLATPL